MSYRIAICVPYLITAIAVVIIGQVMYPLPVHLGAFFTGITGVVISDLHAAWWVVKRSVHLPYRRMVRLHHWVGLAVTASVVSGAIMAWPVRDYLLGEPSFQVKLLFVFALIVNAVFIGRHTQIASTRTFGELTSRERLPLFISGAVSSLAWIGTVIAALLLPL